MRALKLFTAALASCAAALCMCAGLATAGGAAAGGSSAASLGGGFTGSPLIVEGAQELLGGEQARAQRQAELADPHAADERAASRTRFEHLDAAGAVALAARAFPHAVNDRAGGPPSLPEGEQITSYVGSNAARVTLPGGKHGVAESLEPMAVPSGEGRFTPIDLALRQTSGGYEPTVSDVGTRIPEHLSAGVLASARGLGLTPVDAHGRPLEGAPGAVDGASVIYANTQTDADTLVKPTTGGVQVDALLRSADSPEQLYFKVGMPAGAELVSDPRIRGARVTLEGRTIAIVSAPGAQDAAGTSVPLSVRVIGDTLALTVAHTAGEYEYPIDVDPTEYDSTLGLPSSAGTNWQYHAENAGKFEYYMGEGPIMGTVYADSVASGEYSEFEYEAHGKSSVMWIEEASSVGANVESGAVTKLEFGYGGKPLSQENYLTLANAGESYGRRVNTLCVPKNGPVCGEGTIAEQNRVIFIQTATKNAPPGYGFWGKLYTATVGIRQEDSPEIAFNNSESTLSHDEGRQNVLYGSGRWLSEHNGAFEIVAKDPGLGVSDAKIRMVSGGTWSYDEPLLADGLCSGVWCQPEFRTHATYSPSMADGEDVFEACAEDGARMQACKDATVNVDNTKPTNIQLKGIAETGAEISASPHQITVEATDPKAHSSGIKSISVSIDGREIGTPAGSCSPGECTASGTWTIEGESLGAGEHKLTVIATDNANNQSEPKVYTFAIRNATPLHVSPGTVDPVTGQFSLSVSDVDAAGVGSISRTYRSRLSSVGLEGPVGSQWGLSVGVGETLKVLANNNVEVTGTGGEPTTFEYVEKAYVAPPGDGNLTLEAKEAEPGKGVTEYLLKNATAGRTTKFSHPTGSSMWAPMATEGSAPDEKTSYGYRVTQAYVKGRWTQSIAEPTEVLGPVPANVTCGKNPQEVKLEELKPGCRALSLTYAEKTSAGSNPSEWGEYEGQVKQISLTAYNPATKAMQTTPVAEYSYDNLGRLRAEWDPRISPALKTTYGYNSAWGLTALVPPGQAPWLFTYGTISGDTGEGRLLKVTRPPASSGLWKGEVPQNTQVPIVTGSAAVGVRLAVSNGTWSGNPVAYGYQWEDCNGWGMCSPIGGATNANYTPVSSDLGYHLEAVVRAVNGDGTVSATSAATAVVVGSKNTQAVDSGTAINAVSCISGTSTCVLGDNAGKAFYATNVSTTANATWTGWSGPGTSPSEAVDCQSTQLCLMAAGSKEGFGGTLYYATALGGTWTQAVNPSYGVDAISCPSQSLCVEAQDNLGYFRYSTNPASTSWTLESQGSAPMKGVFCLSSSFCAIADGAGSVHVATSTTQIESSSWTATDVDGTTALNGVACTSTTSCVAVDGAGDVVNLTIGTKGEATAVKHDIDGSNSLAAVTCTGTTCVAVDNQGNVFVSTNSGETWTNGYQVGTALKAVSCASASLCVAVDSAGNVTALNPGVATTGESHSPQPGTTIEYRVPVSGSGAPHQMTSAELAKWAQTKDLPVEATAVVPPDEPMGWPATSYTRAMVTYMDSHARTVNRAAPSGAISTVEYNTLNEVTRTLNSANRATALGEGSKSAEAAEVLSSKEVYNAEGTELLETYGPQHKIRLSNGTEVNTRDRHKFSYNEEAPGGEPHNLVTKVTTWSETPLKEVIDKQEAKTSYNGQKQLGWTLRKPTQTTSEANGQMATKTVAYNRETGLPTETFTTVSAQAPVYSLQFGTSGSGNGQLKTPSAAALDAHGNVWVADRGNNRVEEFSAVGQFIAAYGAEGTAAGQFKGPEGIAVNQGTGNVYVTDSGNNRVQELSSEGKFVATYGFGVSNGEAKYQTCTSACQAGISGSGAGQFNDPVGVALDASGDVWVVDHANNRVEEFSATNGYLATYGSKGTGEAQFKEPDYVAVSGGNLYVTDAGNVRVEEISKSGAYLGEFGSTGSGAGQFAHPVGIAANPSTGALYVGDPTNSRVEEFSQAGVYVAQFGSAGTGNGQLKEPAGLAADGGNEIYVVDTGNARVEGWERPTAAPVFDLQFGNGDFAHATSDAIDAHGNVWVANAYGNNIQEFAASGAHLATYSEWGTGAGQVKEPIGIAVNQATGNVYVGDDQNNRVDEFDEKGKFVAAFGYGVSNGEEALQVCTTTCIAGLRGGHAGEFNEAGWIAIDSYGDIWVGDESNNRVQEFNAKDEFLRTFGFGVSNGAAEFQVCTSGCQAGTAGSGAGQFSNPTGIAVAGEHLYVGDLSNRIQIFNLQGSYIGQFGSSGSGNGQFKYLSGVAVDAVGDVYAVDDGNSRIEQFTASGTYVRTISDKGSGNGQMSEPEGVALGAGGNIVAVDSGNDRLEQWASAPSPGNEGANDSRTIYYSAAANAEYPSCGNHPEWANLACQTEPTVQPGDSGPPPLPLTTTTYNMWDEPETMVEKLGSVTRTTTKTYDSAGRELASEETSSSSEEAALPAVTDQYNSEDGALASQSETLEGKAKTTSSEYNSLGQLVSYTDASGATTKYTYDIDGRVEEISEPKGRQIYSYDPVSGFLTKLLDTAAGTFTASYDVAGNMLTEGYPNGMTAKYASNPIGQTTSVEYEKTTNCSEKCVWFSDSEAFGPTGHVAYQASTLSTETYTYDEAGRLTQTQETPAGKGCITRLYAYNEETSQRESTTTREPNEKGECASEGGLVEGHFYDVTGRMIDPGVSYDALGNMTKVPALDAGGSAVTSSFYVDNQVATQEQSEKTVAYAYDPGGRTMLATLKTKSGTTTTISHYSSPGEARTWTCEEAGECKLESEEKWTRNIPGIGETLDAIQTNGGAPVLQLHDLQGNVVATAADNPTETKLLSTNNSTEFGVTGATAPKYSWRGALDVSSELETGLVTTAGATYVPQIAQLLQSEQQIPPGAAPNGVGDAELYRTYESQAAIEGGRESAGNIVAEQRSLECDADPLSCIQQEDPTPWYSEYGIDHAAFIAWEIEQLEQQNAVEELVELAGDPKKAIEDSIVAIFGDDNIDAWDKSEEEQLNKCVKVLEAWKTEKGGCLVRKQTTMLIKIHILGLNIERLESIDFKKMPEVAVCKRWYTEGKVRRLTECYYHRV